jgi:hypothetical protein
VAVVHAEELPFAPLDYHLVRADLEISSPDRGTFQTTVQKLITWQAPPPRQGQRHSYWCDSEAWRHFFVDADYSSLLGAFQSVLSIGTVP